jgi:hypothetical protein
MVITGLVIGFGFAVTKTGRDSSIIPRSSGKESRAFAGPGCGIRGVVAASHRGFRLLVAPSQNIHSSGYLRGIDCIIR